MWNLWYKFGSLVTFTTLRIVREFLYFLRRSFAYHSQRELCKLQLWTLSRDGHRFFANRQLSSRKKGLPGLVIFLKMRTVREELFAVNPSRIVKIFSISTVVNIGVIILFNGADSCRPAYRIKVSDFSAVSALFPFCWADSGMGVGSSTEVASTARACRLSVAGLGSFPTFGCVSLSGTMGFWGFLRICFVTSASASCSLRGKNGVCSFCSASFDNISISLTCLEGTTNGQ